MIFRHIWHHRKRMISDVWTTRNLGLQHPFLAKVQPKLSTQHLGPEVFLALAPFTFFLMLFLNKPSSHRISAEGTPLESIIAIGGRRQFQPPKPTKNHLCSMSQPCFYWTVSSCKASKWLKVQTVLPPTSLREFVGGVFWDIG